VSPGHPVPLAVVLKLSGLTHTSVSEQHHAGHAIAVRKPDRMIVEETPERTLRIIKKSGGERRLSSCWQPPAAPRVPRSCCHTAHAIAEPADIPAAREKRERSGTGVFFVVAGALHVMVAWW
jgi:hypothetical protein